ncbi:unnamed protein product [Meloidogyne enterolobii]|uniref:Uncharacterized protein n=1 Tax=Meloidogyne enterolobii TaxID=390850 RepID=A0ACB0YQ01_MELEN
MSPSNRIIEKTEAWAFYQRKYLILKVPLASLHCHPMFQYIPSGNPCLMLIPLSLIVKTKQLLCELIFFPFLFRKLVFCQFLFVFFVNIRKSVNLIGPKTGSGLEQIKMVGEGNGV